MKRKIALIMCAVMLFTVMLPSFVFAEGDKGLENAIKTAKATFTIPSDFSFRYDVYTENGERTWTLNWSSKDGTKGGINVRVNDKGTILGYDNYKPIDNTERKLPKLSRQEAKAKAESFIKKINPGIVNQIRLQDNNGTQSITDYTYSFYYVRQVNNIPFYTNNISVSVNKDTGEVLSYNYNWTDGLTFPAPGKAISLNDANKAFIDKLGIKLVYKYTLDNDKIKTYPAFVPKYGDNYAIDALTGEKIVTGYSYVFAENATDQIYNKKEMDSKGGGVSLTPDEIKAIEEASKLISQEDAEKMSRDSEFLKLSLDYKLANAYLNRGWPNQDNLYWTLYFYKEADDQGKGAGSVSVTINAKTGEFTGFNVPSNSSDKDPVKYDEAAAKAAVEVFLNTFNKAKYSQTEFYDGGNDPLISKSSEVPRSYYFTYCRKVNGVQFPDNYISVNFDAVSGEVTGYNLNWFDTDFQSVEKALSTDKAYGKVFSQVGLELQYRVKYSQEVNEKIIPTPATGGKPETVLVYSLKTSKPWVFDAFTGAVLDYDGKPYKEAGTVTYTDIKGHPSQKQIEILAEYGISLEGTKFRPNEKITQQDFLILLSKIMPNYYGPYITSSSKTAEVDSLYSYLANEKIIRGSEKAPKAAVTKEDGVKFFIRALKYDKAADLKGIYKCSFKDASKINPQLYGYFAIAGGLKIISADKKGNINPKASLTRADAIVMIYNYLNN